MGTPQPSIPRTPSPPTPQPSIPPTPSPGPVPHYGPIGSWNSVGPDCVERIQNGRTCYQCADVPTNSFCKQVGGFIIHPYPEDACLALAYGHFDSDNCLALYNTLPGAASIKDTITACQVAVKAC